MFIKIGSISVTSNKRKVTQNARTSLVFALPLLAFQLIPLLAALKEVNWNQGFFTSFANSVPPNKEVN